jgi:Fe2+ or Zn2+ uptake regulation protein
VNQNIDKVLKLDDVWSVPGSTEQLREHGLPVTAQRLAVLRAVERHPHNTADEIARSVLLRVFRLRTNMVM